MRILSLMLFPLLFISGCEQNSLRIGNGVDICCPGDYANYHSFNVETHELPFFMRDYVVNEFISALEQRGLHYNEQVSDLQIALVYRHINLNADQQQIDPFVTQSIIDGESVETELRYIATIDIIMRESTTNKVIWAGEVHRLHTPRAIAAFRESFRDLLQHYPAPLDAASVPATQL